MFSLVQKLSLSRLAEADATSSNSHVAGILRDRLGVVEEILATTRQPAVSIGVIHQGSRVFEHHYGTIDIESGQKPTGDTLYCIASLSKAFIAAAIDLLDQRGLLQWDTSIASLLPEYARLDDDPMLARMTLRDICSHRTGLLGLDELIQGMDGRILSSKSEVIDIVNALPKKQSFRDSFTYNNALYELAGRVIETVSKRDNWGHFLQEEIFAPLGMKRTTAFRGIHETDDNIAKAYMALTDQSLSEIAPTELSANSMNGGSGGLRSSVNDLLTWCCSLLDSFNNSTANLTGPIRHQSTVFHRATMPNSSSVQSGDYGTGWCYHRTPSQLGLISPNRALQSPTIGASSQSLLLYGHQGDVPGYTSSLYLIPATQSAIVVLSNGTGLSDATDWISQDFIQAMYGLQPSIDYVELASRAASLYVSHFERDFLIPLQKHRVPGTKASPLNELIGEYVMEGLDSMVLQVEISTNDPERLTLCVNRHRDQVHPMWHYHFDEWCYLPATFDDCLRRGLDREDSMSWLISFHRDIEDGVVQIISWKLSGVEVLFRKRQYTSCS